MTDTFSEETKELISASQGAQAATARGSIDNDYVKKLHRRALTLEQAIVQIREVCDVNAHPEARHDLALKFVRSVASAAIVTSRLKEEPKLSPDLKASQRPTVPSETNPTRPPSQPGREEVGRAIYLAMYAHKGGRWECNEAKDVWYDMADRFFAILSLTKGTEPGAVTDGREQQDHDIADNANRALHEIAHLPDGSDLHEATLIALRALPLIEDKPEGAFHRSWCAWCGGTCECDEDPPDDLSDGLPHLNRSEHTSADFAACEDCPPLSYPTDKTRCTPCPRRALSRNSTDE